MQIPKLAVIVPCYNEESCLEATCKRLLEVIELLVNKGKISPESYLYFVDDGSVDSTWSLIEKFHNNDTRVKGLKFIRNYGNQRALIAGLECVRDLGCDCAISIDADLQQDEFAIERFIDKFNEGFDVVLGIRKSRKTDSLFKKTTAYLFYKTMNLLGAKIPPNHSDYRLVSKKALDAMEMYPEKALFLRGFFYELGLKTAIVKFDVKPRMAGKSKFNFLSLMGLALNGITSFSIVPLRIVSVIGLIMAVVAFCVAIEAIVAKILFHNVFHGVTTMISLVGFVGGVQIFCLGVIGEYVGQVYNEVKARPRYIKDVELK